MRRYLQTTSLQILMISLVLTSAWGQSPLRLKPRSAQPPLASTQNEIATPFVVPKGFSAVLGLNNATREGFFVQPRIRTADGEVLWLPSVEIPAASHIDVHLDEYLRQSGGQATGTVYAAFSSVPNGLGAMVLVGDESGRMGWSHLLQGPKNFASRRLEGIWWKPERSTATVLVLSNLTDQKLQSEVTITNAEGRGLQKPRVLLKPYASVTHEIPYRGWGGVSVSYDATPGSVRAQLISFDRSNGFSAGLPLTDTSTLRSSELHGAGATFVEGGEPLITHLLARNMSSSRIDITGELDSDAEDTQLDPVSLAPGETKDIQVPPSGVTNGLKIRHSGSPQDVLALLYSVDKSGDLVIETPLKAVTEKERLGGNHPWSIAGGMSAVLYIKNAGTQKGYFTGAVSHSQGMYMLGRREVGTGKTISIDLRELRDQQIPDGLGNIIPAEIDNGQVAWYPLREAPMVGRVLLLTPDHKLARNMSCPYCGPCQPEYAELFIYPSDTTKDQDDIFNFTIEAKEYGCYNPVTYTDTNLVTWSSYDPFTVDVDGATATCLWPGSTTIRGEWSTYISFQGEGCEWTPYTPADTSGVTVRPKATITVKVTGSKTSGNNLDFPSSSCTQNLGGPHSCAYWNWNVEVKAVVSDNAANWTTLQSYTGRRKGKYSSGGTLHDFDDPLSKPIDDPPPAYTQQTSGQTLIFWLDSPGHLFTYDNDAPIDSITQVQNFVSKVCSTVNTSVCATVNWHLKLVVSSGGSTTGTTAGTGHISTSF